MYKFGETSIRRLCTVTKNLDSVCRRALSYGVMDATVIEGSRGAAEQDRYFAIGKSRVKWPNGKHNRLPSKAVDIAPYVNGAVSWNKNHCLVWAGLMLAAAAELGVTLRWGGNWDMDGEPITDQEFQDLVHFEEAS